MRLDCHSSDWEFFFKSVQVLSGNTTRYYFEAIQKYIDEFFTASHSDFDATPIAFIDAPDENVAVWRDQSLTSM